MAIPLPLLVVEVHPPGEHSISHWGITTNLMSPHRGVIINAAFGPNYHSLPLGAQLTKAG
ncbi:hypothetical protein GCM10023208_25310 [Erythrobacter westpacificensis]|uniref:Uncharacterized protein n=1 Tax=Erythrobacter westpacificensis TaxID=1055231 RepID=A0ABP9KGV9_9SPHN